MFLGWACKWAGVRYSQPKNQTNGWRSGVLWKQNLIGNRLFRFSPPPAISLTSIVAIGCLMPRSFKTLNSSQHYTLEWHFHFPGAVGAFLSIHSSFIHIDAFFIWRRAIRLITNPISLARFYNFNHHFRWFYIVTGRVDTLIVNQEKAITPLPLTVSHLFLNWRIYVWLRHRNFV